MCKSKLDTKDTTIIHNQKFKLKIPNILFAVDLLKILVTATKGIATESIYIILTNIGLNILL